MSRRIDPPYRPPDDALDGAAGCGAFVFFLMIELLVAGGAGGAAYMLGRNGPIDLGHEIGIGAALLGGAAALVWIDHHCRRITGYSAGEIAMEAMSAWW